MLAYLLSLSMNNKRNTGETYLLISVKYIYNETNRNIKKSVHCQYGQYSLTFRTLVLRQRERPLIIFTRAYFLRFPDRLIKLFQVKCSFLDKLTHSQTQLLVSNVAGKYRGFIYAHNTYNCTRRSWQTTLKDDERFRNLTRILRTFS